MNIVFDQAVNHNNQFYFLFLLDFVFSFFFFYALSFRGDKVIDICRISQHYQWNSKKREKNNKQLKHEPHIHSFIQYLIDMWFCRKNLLRYLHRFQVSYALCLLLTTIFLASISNRSNKRVENKQKWKRNRANH